MLELENPYVRERVLRLVHHTLTDVSGALHRYLRSRKGKRVSLCGVRFYAPLMGGYEAVAVCGRTHRTRTLHIRHNSDPNTPVAIFGKTFQYVEQGGEERQSWERDIARFLLIQTRLDRLLNAGII